MIASEAPVSGELSQPNGLGIQHAVELAVREKRTVRGFTLITRGFDDTLAGRLSPDRAEQNVRQIVANAGILGIVGPVNSLIAYRVLPIANAADLAVISPSATSPCLTVEEPSCGVLPSSLRPSGRNNFFRVVAADTFQGTALADYTVDTLHVKTVAVFSDSLAAEVALADAFSTAFVRRGGQVVLRHDFDMRTQSDFRDFLNAARDRGAQAIFAAAGAGTKGCVARAQMQPIFPPAAYYLGPDSLVADQCIQDAGAGANDHVYATIDAVDPRESHDAAVQRVVEAYQKAFPGDEITPYTFSAYDCTEILIDAIGRAIDGNGGRMPTRSQVVDAVARTNQLKATTGTFSFDANGDPTMPEVSLFRIEAGRWTFVRVFAFTNG